MLLDRERELAAIDGLLEDIPEGRGRLLAVRGPAGIGKSELLGAARERAARAGLAVLAARSSMLERSFAFGVVRQLLETYLARLDEPARRAALAGSAGLAGPVLGLPMPGDARPPADPHQASLLGLFWLVVGLTERRPALLVVDDAHWADPASLSWLTYLAHRLDGIPVGVVVAARDGVDPEGIELNALLEESEQVAVQPLGRDAVARLLNERLDDVAHERFLAACVRASGGNPLLVNELVRALRDDGLEPTAENAARIEAVTSARLQSWAQARLDGLGPAARTVAEAAAILDDDASLRTATALTGLEFNDAIAAADALRSAGILRASAALSYVHPLVRQAIHSTIPAGRRAVLHAAAARELHAEHRAPERIAAHLLASEPASDPWVVEQLQTTAARALGEGAPREAVRLLERALDEGAPTPRDPLLMALGQAKARLRDPGAIAHFDSVRSTARDAAVAAHAALWLGRMLIVMGEPARGFALLDEMIPELRSTDPEMAMRLEAELSSAARLDRDWAARTAQRLGAITGPLSGDTPGERALLACLAGEQIVQALSATRAVELAERALRGTVLLREATCESPVFFLACATLTWSGRPGLARTHLDAAFEDSRARGSPVGFAHASAWTAEAALGEGSLREVAAHAHAALDASRPLGYMVARPLAASWLALALIEQMRLTEADAVLASEVVWRTPPDGADATQLYARGMLRLRQRRPGDALVDFEAAGRVQLERVVRSGSVSPWRTGTALALAALGRVDDAERMAHEELVLARRAGTRHTVGIALRALASLKRASEAVEPLREAVTVLEATEARLEHAHALAALGGALRRAGARRDAREPLRLALELAVECDATRLRERVGQELLSSGARPRRIRMSGRDALTPAELRVAELAAEGLSNREIAQELFVTIKTVETQLGHAYAKLGIHTRRELPEALSGESARAAPIGRAARETNLGGVP